MQPFNLVLFLYYNLMWRKASAGSSSLQTKHQNLYLEYREKNLYLQNADKSLDIKMHTLLCLMKTSL